LCTPKKACWSEFEMLFHNLLINRYYPIFALHKKLYSAIMSIIQTLRDRAAILVFGIIAISLIGFLVQDAFVGRTSSLFRGSTSSLGSIDGESIKRDDFEERVKSAEAQYQSQGYRVDEGTRQEIYGQIWNGFINKALLESETRKLGLNFTRKELSALLFSNRAPQQFREQFTDPQTGIYDIAAAQNAIRNLQRSKNEAQLKQVTEQLLDPISLNQLRLKFLAIYTQGVYYPKWLVEKQNTENSLISSISYTGLSYATMPDSSVKVTDDEINAYIQKHKESFKQERSRSIAYVTFSAAPSKEDSAALYKKMVDLKPAFVEATDVTTFLNKNGSKTPFYDGFLGKTRIQIQVKDSIFNLAPGQVFGPYLDAGSYVLAKLIGTKTLPDSAKARHILIATHNPRTGEEILPDSTAKRKIDSVELAIRNGASFDSLVRKYSDDKTSAVNGGDLGYFPQGQMVKSFNDFCFEKNKGDKGVVRTEYGYHYIEIEDQKNFEPAYKIAYLSKPIEASVETDRAASAAATQFSANSRSQKAFDANVQKQNLNKRIADNITEMAYQSGQGLGVSRQFVKWIYENKPGDVSDPISIGDQYVVAVITGEKKEGIQDASTARFIVEPIVRNEKKGGLLAQKFGKYNTIEELAAKLGQQPSTADSIRFAENFNRAFGNELFLIGASVNKNYQEKVSPPLQGSNGVYAVRVNNIGALPNAEANVDEQQKLLTNSAKQNVEQYVMTSLRDAAKIKDKRFAAGY
jgi:peptidyl-prolyl cis-trans isomerase D